MRRKAFTLVELMTVVAILAILYAVLMPVVIQVKCYAQQWVAGEAIAKVGQATSLYMMDSDQTYPLAYYSTGDGRRQNWFGIVAADGSVDPATSLLKPYIKGKIQRDYALNALPWDGDDSGYGYNWGYLGSDYYQPTSWSDSQNCVNPASDSSLGDTSSTVEFATTSFFYATWMPKGDGQTYRYGFADPPDVWFGNPTVDFRHMAIKTIDKKAHEVKSTGLAIILFSDDHVKPLHQKDVTQKMFERNNGLGATLEP